jgi:hypothetical protein
MAFLQPPREFSKTSLRLTTVICSSRVALEQLLHTKKQQNCLGKSGKIIKHLAGVQ